MTACPRCKALRKLRANFDLPYHPFNSDSEANLRLAKTSETEELEAETFECLDKNNILRLYELKDAIHADSGNLDRIKSQPIEGQIQTVEYPMPKTVEDPMSNEAETRWINRCSSILAIIALSGLAVWQATGDREFKSEYYFFALFPGAFAYTFLAMFLFLKPIRNVVTLGGLHRRLKEFEQYREQCKAQKAEADRQMAETQAERRMQQMQQMWPFREKIDAGIKEICDITSAALVSHRDSLLYRRRNNAPGFARALTEYERLIAFLRTATRGISRVWGHIEEHHEYANSRRFSIGLVRTGISQKLEHESLQKWVQEEMGTEQIPEATQQRETKDSQNLSEELVAKGSNLFGVSERVAALKRNIEDHKKHYLEGRRVDAPGFWFDLTEYERLIEGARRECEMAKMPSRWLDYHIFYAKSHRDTAEFSVTTATQRSQVAATESIEEVQGGAVSSDLIAIVEEPSTVAEPKPNPNETTFSQQPREGKTGQKILDLDVNLVPVPAPVLPLSRPDSVLSSPNENTEPLNPEGADDQGQSEAEPSPGRATIKEAQRPLRHKTTPPEKLFANTSRIINWEELNSIRKKTGNEGEEVVYLLEYQYLIDAGRFDLAGKVKNVSKDLGDGAGYDVLSYFLDGRPKYIEVKTTSSDIDRPFYLSKNERDFMERERETCFVYRVSLADLPPSVRVYTVDQLFADSEITPTQFLVKMNIHNDPIISFEN